MLVPMSGSFVAWVILKDNSVDTLHSKLLRVFIIIGLNGAATNDIVVKVSLNDHKEANKFVVS